MYHVCYICYTPLLIKQWEIGTSMVSIIFIEKKRLKLTGWWLGHPSEKYGPSSGMIRHPILMGTLKNGNQTTNQEINVVKTMP